RVLRQAPSPPRPAAPAMAELVRNCLRLWLGIEHLPDPNGWVHLSLASCRLAPSGKNRRLRGMSPRIAGPDRRSQLCGRASPTATLVLPCECRQTVESRGSVASPRMAGVGAQGSLHAGALLLPQVAPTAGPRGAQPTRRGEAIAPATRTRTLSALPGR